MGQSTENEKLNEIKLVEKAKTDNQAFEELYDKYFSQMYGYIFKRTGQRELTEDIVSNVFIKVFTNLNEYKAKNNSFKSWLYKIATNTLIDHFRKSSVKKEFLTEELPEIVDESYDHVRRVEVQENQKIVQKTLEKLPEQYKKILYLKFFSELTNIEIAEILAISPNNVGVLLYRALKKFEKLYTKTSI